MNFIRYILIMAFGITEIIVASQPPCPTKPIAVVTARDLICEATSLESTRTLSSGFSSNTVSPLRRDSSDNEIDDAFSTISLKSQELLGEENSVLEKIESCSLNQQQKHEKYTQLEQHLVKQLNVIVAQKKAIENKRISMEASEALSNMYYEYPGSSPRAYTPTQASRCVCPQVALHEYPCP